MNYISKMQCLIIVNPGLVSKTNFKLTEIIIKINFEKETYFSCLNNDKYEKGLTKDILYILCQI